MQRRAGPSLTHEPAASCAPPTRRQDARVAVLLCAVHAVQLKLSLERGLLEVAARAGERHLVVRCHGQIACETEGSVTLGQLDLSARGCLVLVARASGDRKSVPPPKLGIGRARRTIVL